MKNKSSYISITILIIFFVVIASSFSNFILAGGEGYGDGDNEFGLNIISIDGFRHYFYFFNGNLVTYEVTPVEVDDKNTKNISIISADGFNHTFYITNGIIKDYTVVSFINISGSNDNEFDESLKEGLISYYKLDETSVEVLDSAGSNHGINYGATRGVEGKIGNAFEFNGNGNYVDTKFGNGLIYPDGVSLQLWVRSTDSDDSGLIISRGGGDGATAEFLGINAGSGQGIPCTNVYGVSDVAVCADKTINDNEWHHVVGTYDSSEISIYLDGVKFSDSSIGTAKTTDNFKIGWDDHSSSQTIRFFKGNIDEVGIWNRALSQEEVLHLYNNGEGLVYLTPVF